MTLYHQFDALTNTRGDSLAGYRVIARLPNGGAMQPIYGDINGTPIVSTSGLANTAFTDAAGNYSFFIVSGVYDLEYSTPDGAFVFATRFVPMLAGQDGARGDPGPSGPPGGNVSDIGTFATAKATDIIAAQPGTTTIRLSDRAKATFELYTGATSLPTTYPNDENYWWFRDAGGNVWWIASQVVSIQHVGASVINVDNTAYINAALRFAKAFQRGAYVPVGQWSYGAALYNDSGSLSGEGYGSVLQATSYDASAIYLTGTGPRLAGLRRTYTGDLTRQFNGDDEIANGVTVKADKFSVDQVWIEKGRSAGMMFRDATNGSVTRCRVEDTSADAFHTTRASANIAFAQDYALRPGDDAFPVIGYVQDGVFPTNISYSQCIADTGASRGWIVSGGSDVSATACVAKSCKAGFMAGSDASGTQGTYACINIKWLGCTAHDCGDNGKGYGAVHLNARAGYDTTDVDVVDMTITNAVKQGVVMLNSGGTVGQVHLDNLRIRGTGTHGVEVEGEVDLTVTDCKFFNIGQSAVFVGAASGRIEIRSALMQNINTSQTGGADAIHFEGGSTFDRIILENNEARVPAGGSQLYERLIECPYDAQAENNIGPGDVAIGSPLYSQKQRVRGAAQANSTATASNANNAGAAPGSLSAAVSQTDFNALVGQANATAGALNTLKGDYNALLGNLRAAGLIAS